MACEDDSPPNSLPWFRDTNSKHPFSLAKKIISSDPKATPLRTIAFFPWNKTSLETLWRGSFNTVEFVLPWETMISEFSDAVAVGGVRKLYLFFTQSPKYPVCIQLPEDSPKVDILPTDRLNIAWALHPDAPFEPLLIFSNLSLLYVYNVKKERIVSYLRGHGGAITCIAVHPNLPHLFCTTSRDTSTRIYDLNLAPQEVPVNTHWPPSAHESRAGAAHGLHMSESEGRGMGRCFLVLMGGRSGGHNAAVLGADFHPHLPIVATCGLDRVVKIWFIPRADQVMLSRQDKPLFSSGRIHKARVLSVTWVDHEVLLTYSAPSVMRIDVNDVENKQTQLEPGQLTVWRWLGMDRFFPPGQEENPQDVLRGCSSDYQESASFKVVSTSLFPAVASQYIVPNLHVYQSPTHDPLLSFTFPGSTSISMLNAIHLKPRKPLPFPLDEAGLVLSAKRIRLEGGNDETSRENHNKTPADPPELSGWEIKLEAGSSSEARRGNPEKLEACAMGNDGKVVMGVGTKGSMWIWRQR